MKKKTKSNQNKVIEEKEESNANDHVDDDALIRNQLLLASTVTTFGRTEEPSFAAQVINYSLLHLNEFNAEYEYELSQSSMPIEFLDSEHKLLEVRQNLLDEIEKNL